MPDLGKAGGWGLLAVAGALAGLLALSSIASFVNAYRIGEAVVRGEGEVLHRLVERDFPRGRWTTAADLEAILADDRDEGLRYLAILAPDDGVVVEAGVSAERPLRPDDHRGVLAWIGDNLAGDGTVARFERLLGPPPRRDEGPPDVDGKAPPPGMNGKAPPPTNTAARPPPGFDAKAPPNDAAGRPPAGFDAKAASNDAAGRPPAGFDARAAPPADASGPRPTRQLPTAHRGRRR